MQQIFASIRSDVEQRRSLQLARISKAEQLVTDLVNSSDCSMVEVAVTVGRKTTRIRKHMPDLAVVHRAAEVFKEGEFTLDELVEQVGREYPSHKITREMISRRLHDLKKKGFIFLAARESEAAGGKKRYYSLSPPILGCPPPA